MGGENYTPQHDIDYAILDKMDKDIILDYVWEHTDMMDNNQIHKHIQHITS